MTDEQLVLLATDDDRLCEEAYERVFRPAFDPTELPDISEIRPTAGRTVIVALDESGVVAGGVSDTFADSDVGLLSYLATRSDRRSRGWGARLLDGLRSCWRPDAVALVLAEVRDPRAWDTSDCERPSDRLRFYASNGCHLVPVPWVQPSTGGRPREAGLLLISVHGTTPDSVIPASILRKWAVAYYRDSEGATPTDPQYLALIQRLSERDVRMKSIEDYAGVEPLRFAVESERPDS